MGENNGSAFPPETKHQILPISSKVSDYFDKNFSDAEDDIKTLIDYKEIIARLKNSSLVFKDGHSNPLHSIIEYQNYSYFDDFREQVMSLLVALVSSLAGNNNLKYSIRKHQDYFVGQETLITEDIDNAAGDVYSYCYFFKKVYSY